MFFACLGIEPSLNLIIEITDVIPWMSVKPLFQSSLIQKVPNKTNGTSKNKQTVQATVPNHIVRFFVTESPTTAE